MKPTHRVSAAEKGPKLWLILHLYGIKKNSSSTHSRQSYHVLSRIFHKTKFRKMFCPIHNAQFLDSRIDLQSIQKKMQCTSSFFWNKSYTFSLDLWSRLSWKSVFDEL